MSHNARIALVLAILIPTLTAMRCPGGGGGTDDGGRAVDSAASGLATPSASVPGGADAAGGPDLLALGDEQLLREWAAVFEEINDTLDRVSDAESATAARARLGELIDGPLARLRALRERGEFRPDNGESALTWLREHNRFVGNLMRLGANPAVRGVLEEDLDRLLRFFEPTN